MSSAHLAFFLGRLRRGGAERVILTLATGFAERGHRVDLILGDCEGELQSEVPETIRVVELGIPSVLGSLPALLRLPPAAWRIALHPDNPRLLRSAGRLADYLKQSRPDALLSTLRTENLTAIWAGELARVDTRIVVREASTQSTESASESKPVKRDFPRIAARWFPRAYRTIALSQAAARDLVTNTGLPEAAVTTIHNPVDLERVRAQAAQEVRDAWFEPGEPPVVATAGRLVPQKDQATLLRAFALVRSERPARLLILGEGAERPRLEALARSLGTAEDVRLPGSVANPHRYMARARAFVLSSTYEGFPNVLVEALACGCPVISTDSPGGAAEILEAGASGRLVEVGDVEGLARALRDTLDEDCDRERLVRRAADFSLDRALASYERVLLGDS